MEIAFATAEMYAGVVPQQPPNGRVGKQPCDDRTELIGTKGTVCAERVYPQSFQHCDHGFRCGSGHQLAVLSIRVGNQNGQIAVLLCRKDRRLCLITVVHRFNEDQIDPVSDAEPHRFREYLHSVLEIQIAKRF